MKLVNLLLRYAFIFVCIFGVNIAQAQTDPVPPIVAQFASPDLSTRQSAFGQLLALGATGTTTTTSDAVPSLTANVIRAYPNDKTTIILALISLLNEEIQNGTNPTFNAAITDESYDDYFSALIDSVGSLNDIRAIPALAGVISTGRTATDALAAYGPAAIDTVTALVYSTDIGVRDSAALTLQSMLSTSNFGKVNDPVSLSKIRAGLKIAINSFQGSSSWLRATYVPTVNSFPALPVGDLNGDGVVNCADLAIIIASFGKSVGQAGFDIRADVNGDGVVNILDLSAEAKLLPAGTICQ